VVPHIANESRALAIALQLEEHMPRRMAGRGIDLDELVEPVWSAAHQIGFSMLENRNHALAERSQLRGPFLRVDIDFRKVVDVGL